MEDLTVEEYDKFIDECEKRIVDLKQAIADEDKVVAECSALIPVKEQAIFEAQNVVVDLIGERERAQRRIKKNRKLIQHETKDIHDYIQRQTKASYARTNIEKDNQIYDRVEGVFGMSSSYEKANKSRKKRTKKQVERIEESL